MNAYIHYLSVHGTDLLIAFGALAYGFIFILRPQWAPPTRGERVGKFLRRCGITLTAVGIVF
jgi:hypothetical protein